MVAHLGARKQLDLLYNTVGIPTQVLFYVSYLPSVQNRLFKLYIWAILLFVFTSGPLRAVFIFSRVWSYRTDSLWKLLKMMHIERKAHHAKQPQKPQLQFMSYKSSFTKLNRAWFLLVHFFLMEWCECVGYFPLSSFYFCHVVGTALAFWSSWDINIK